MFDVFNDAVDTAFEIGDAFKGEGLDVDNIVLLKDFVRVPTSKPGYKTFYEMRDEVNDIKEQNRNYKEQYGNEYYAILKGSRFNYEITRYYDVYSRQIQSLNEMLMKVTDDKELYNEIESQRDALILEAARTYNEIKQRRDNEN